jgi:cytochrome c oxidase assembly factor CtaG
LFGTFYSLSSFQKVRRQTTVNLGRPFTMEKVITSYLNAEKFPRTKMRLFITCYYALENTFMSTVKFRKCSMMSIHLISTGVSMM